MVRTVTEDNTVLLLDDTGFVIYTINILDIERMT